MRALTISSFSASQSRLRDFRHRKVPAFIVLMRGNGCVTSDIDKVPGLPRREICYIFCFINRKVISHIKGQISQISVD